MIIDDTWILLNTFNELIECNRQQRNQKLYFCGGRMKIKSILFILLIAFIWLSCKSESTKSEDIAVLSGSVYYLDDNDDPAPIENVLISSTNVVAQTFSDGNGEYSLEIEFDEEEKDISLDASKAGFNSRQLSVLAKKGQSIVVPDITLFPLISDTTGGIIDTATHSGPGAHIQVASGHPMHLYVTQTGLQETALIEFEVTDSQGRLLDTDHRVLVNFSILNGPGGGEFVSPDTMTTRNGRCYSVLNSGTVAGPIQLEASFLVDGNTIRTVPIRLAIYGGLPDDRHFSVAIAQGNIAGRIHSGIIDSVTAFVGDKYSNPVAPGTVIYFSTDYGIVEGSAVTDELGRAAVRFMSAAPLPPVPAINPFANITAWTYGDTLGYISIYDSTSILLSDATDVIWVDSTYFTYTALNSPKQFNFRVNDIWGHPLVESTQINVEASTGNLYGDINVQLGDYQSSGSGRTDFQFTWTPGDSLEDPIVFISLRAAPPANGNGFRSISISGERNW